MPLEGTKVRLREVRPEDLPLLVALRNDLDTQGWSLTLPTDYTLHMYRKQYEEESFSTPVSYTHLTLPTNREV